MRFLVLTSLLISAAALHATDENFANSNPLERAKQEFHQGHFDAALTSLQEDEKRASEPNAKELVLRGRVLFEQQKYDEAIAVFEAARKLEPAGLAGLYHGDIFLRQKKWQEARDTYTTAAKESNILTNNERFRYGLLMAALGAKDQEAAQAAFTNLPFPTETPAYYYAQAAWAFSRGAKSDAEKWIKRAEDVFPEKGTAWFARPLYDFGWVKTKPSQFAD